MRRLGIFSICVICSLASIAEAGIIGYSCTDDGGGINSNESFWYNGNPAVLGIAGSQTAASSGTMSSTFTTDTTADPIIKYNNSVFNDTIAPWVGYSVEVKIDVPLADP